MARFLVMDQARIQNRPKAALKRWHEREKLRRPFAGLRFWQKCNDGTHNIASRHWPTSITWSWVIGFQRYWKADGVGTSIWPRKWRAWLPHWWARGGGGGQFSWGPIRVHWQEEMPWREDDHDKADRFVDELRNGPKQATPEKD